MHHLAVLRHKGDSLAHGVGPLLLGGHLTVDYLEDEKQNARDVAAAVVLVISAQDRLLWLQVYGLQGRLKVTM